MRNLALSRHLPAVSRCLPDSGQLVAPCCTRRQTPRTRGGFGVAGALLSGLRLLRGLWPGGREAGVDRQPFRGQTCRGPRMAAVRAGRPEAA